jgi:hypothetical protein
MKKMVKKYESVPYNVGNVFSLEDYISKMKCLQPKDLSKDLRK